MDRYSNLTQMLALNPTAYTYFCDLPEPIRCRIAAQREFIHSLDELCRYAEFLAHRS